MSTNQNSLSGYRKIEVDNAVCKRRFHITFQDNPSLAVPHTQVECPHCGVTLYEATNHTPLTLVREENLVKSPDGSRPTVYECRFTT